MLPSEYSILGIDPGKTTGLFYAKFIDGRQHMAVRDEWDWNDMVRRLPEWLGGNHNTPTQVVTERFVINRRTAELTAQQTAIEVIGLVRYLCQINDTSFALQTKSNLTKMAPDTVMKAITAKTGSPWFVKGTAGHANDAARHVLLGLSRYRPDLFDVVAP